MSNATDDNLRAAAQMGATHAFINNANVENGHFEFDQLLRLRHRIGHVGLQLEGLETSHPPIGRMCLPPGPDGTSKSTTSAARLKTWDVPAFGSSATTSPSSKSGATGVRTMRSADMAAAG
jgi:hypothetical protein